MTRCIHCTRCVRFGTEIVGNEFFGTLNRGNSTEIGSYIENIFDSNISGNVIDLCPVGALTSKPYAFKARSWELKKTETIDIMDAVGSNIRIDSRGVEVMRILPRLNEEINEEWISDKARFCYDGIKYQRLDKPYLKINGKLTAVDFAQCYSKIAEFIKTLQPSEIGALTGDLSSVDDIFALQNLMQKLHVENIDCRLTNQQFLDKSNSADFLFNSTIAKIDEADSCLLIGVNPRKDAPIINARLRKRFLSNKLKIALIGDELDLTYPYDFLGNQLKTLQEIYAGTHPYSKILESSSRAMIILGEDAVSRSDGAQIIALCQAISHKYKLINNDWNGYNFLAKSTGLINGLALGFYGKKSSAQILEEAEKGLIKILFLHQVDDHIDFAKLTNCMVVYIGTNGDKATKIADVILPAHNFAEKEALYINIEGRIQKTRRAVFAPNLAKNDVEIFVELARELAIDLGFNDSKTLAEKLFTQHQFIVNKIIPSNSLKLSTEVKFNFADDALTIHDYDYYLTNSIARASRILNKCSAENNLLKSANH